MPFPHLPLATGLGRSAPEIIFYGTGIALLVGAAFLLPHRGVRWGRSFERALARLSLHRTLAVTLVGIAAFAIAAAITACVGVPQPKVDDEFSYLLAADTFTHGRLANPPHPMWEQFETFHVLQQPTYSSKYPPGQGLLLALGQWIAHPVVGVWLASAFACAAITWMLMAWLRPRWALLGGLLAAVHPEVIVWSQRYWGGGLPLAGGALAIGGFRRVVLPCAAVLCVALAWLGFYNSRVTGNALLMPYQLHTAQYMAAPIFIWQNAPPQPLYRHADMQDFHTGWEYRGYEKQRTPAGLATGIAERTWRLIRGEMRMWFLSISLLALPWAMRRDGWMRFTFALTFAFFTALMFVNWTFFHYAAPVFGLFFFSSVQCMRHLRTWRWHGRPVGLFLARASVFLCVLSAIESAREVAAQFPDGWAGQRQQIAEQLHTAGGRHLIVIRYAPDVVNSATHGYRDWTRNGSDIDGSEIVWARAMDADRNARLLDYYKDRRAWLLDVGIHSTTLLPYPL